jgi:mycothiol synthase
VTSAWAIVDRLDADDARWTDALFADILRRTGDEPLSETQQARLDTGSPLRHALKRVGGVLTAYGVLADVEGVVEAEAALGTFDDGFAGLLDQLGRPKALLLRGADAAAEPRLVEHGWELTRTVLRLHRPLPAQDPGTAPVKVRAFVPGVDDEAWLAENNAAFGAHPSQGHMTMERLRTHVKAPWFDPEGFRLYFKGTELVASCWTKVHHPPGGAVGEIYVISVSPSAQGQGLGRFAVLEGLSYLATLGIAAAELYVESTNTSARRLYESLGFVETSRVVELRRPA